MRTRPPMTPAAMTIALRGAALVAVLHLGWGRSEPTPSAETFDGLSALPGPMYQVRRGWEGYGLAARSAHRLRGRSSASRSTPWTARDDHKLEFGGADPDSVPYPIEIAITPTDANEPSCVLGLVVPQGGSAQDPSYLLTIRGPTDTEGKLPILRCRLRSRPRAPSHAWSFALVPPYWASRRCHVPSTARRSASAASALRRSLMAPVWWVPAFWERTVLLLCGGVDSMGQASPHLW